MLLNMAGHAVQLTGRGVVRLVVAVQDDLARISVIDTGPGSDLSFSLSQKVAALMRACTFAVVVPTFASFTAVLETRES